MSRTPRKPELVAIVRSALLDAATSVFARKGYSAATMNEIATAAGYTGPALYKYFKGKQELFEALLERMNAEVNAAHAEIREGLSFEEHVEALLRTDYELVDRRAEMFAVVTSIRLRAEVGVSPRVAKRQQEESRRRSERLIEWFVRAAGSQRIGGVAASDAAMFFMALERGLYLQWSADVAEQGEKVAGKFADRAPLALRLFLYGVRGELERATRRVPAATNTGKRK